MYDANFALKKQNEFVKQKIMCFNESDAVCVEKDFGRIESLSRNYFPFIQAMQFALKKIVEESKR